MTLDLRVDLESELEALADERYCASAAGIASDLISLTLPPEELSTTECAERYRFMRSREGGGDRKRRWLRHLTPYVCAIQDALDDPRYRFVAVVGPGRAGKSVAGENHLFKRLRNGPMVDVIIYLQADSDVSSYANKEFRDFFELHDEIRDKLGAKPTDNKLTLKRLAGRTVQLLPANMSNVRQKEATLIIATEIDGYRPAVREGFKDNIATRMQASGNQAKAYIESHPDLGTTGPMVTIYQDSTRGLWYWRCVHCAKVSCPHPMAPKGMYMPLIYDRQNSLGPDAMLDLVEESAALQCQHCGKLQRDADKQALLDSGFWVFDGQKVTPGGRVTGKPRESDTAGFWIHGTMSPFITLGEMARKYVAALVYFENTRKPKRLKEVVVKTFGEVYEGSSAASGKALAERADDAAGFDVGTCPPEVLFITSAVDVGGSKFDVGFWGWDLEGRSWLLDRVTLRQRRWADDRIRDLRPAERFEDWLILEREVIDRTFPIVGRPYAAMPVAVICIDVGDGHVTKNGREFAWRMAGKRWGPFPRVKLIRGAKSQTAPEVPVKGTEVSKDENGQPLARTVLEWQLGVHELKTWALETLAVEDDGPGQCYFARGLPASTFTEFAGEAYVDGKWERRGPNESLDLFGYAKAGRVMLKPDRVTINWDVSRPIWARPIVAVAEPDAAEPGAAPPEKAKKPSIFERFDRLNSEE